MCASLKNKMPSGPWYSQEGVGIFLRAIHCAEGGLGTIPTPVPFMDLLRGPKYPPLSRGCQEASTGVERLSRYQTPKVTIWRGFSGMVSSPSISKRKINLNLQVIIRSEERPEPSPQRKAISHKIRFLLRRCRQRVPYMRSYSVVSLEAVFGR